MGRRSKIDAHPDRKKIVKRLASGEEYSDIIRDYPDLNWDDLDYYAKKKLPELLSKSQDLMSEIEADQANDTLEEVRSLKDKAIKILDVAQKAGDLKTALLGIREARGCLESILKAEGKIKPPGINVNLNIYESPEWSKVGALLAEVLKPYPDLKAEVAKRLLVLARSEHEPEG